MQGRGNFHCWLLHCFTNYSYETGTNSDLDKIITKLVQNYALRIHHNNSYYTSFQKMNEQLKKMLDEDKDRKYGKDLLISRLVGSLFTSSLLSIL